MATSFKRDTTVKSIDKTSSKYKLNCQSRIKEDYPTTEKWLKVLKKIPTVPILIGKLDITKKTIVVKFENYEEMSKEYEVSKILYKEKIPNLIKFYCFFSCNEDREKFKILETVEKDTPLCTGPGKETGFIIMPYYEIGSVMKYKWNSQNLDTLKNIISQTILALCSAYIKTGFVHLDLHLNNILLRKTKKEKITYKDIDIIVNSGGLYSIILDFERSKFKGDIEEFKTSLYKLTNNLRDIDPNTFIILDNYYITTYIRSITAINKKSIVGLIKKIFEMKIAYIKRN